MSTVDTGKATDLHSESRRLNKKDPWLKQAEGERDDPNFVIPDGAEIITLKSWTRDSVNIDVEGFRSAYVIDQYGLVEPKARSAEQIQAKVDQFSRALRADSRLYRRLSSIAKRTSIRNTNRPQSTSPVKGFGYKEFGPEVGLSQGALQDKVVHNSLGSKTLSVLSERLHKEFAYIDEVDKTRINLTKSSDDPVALFLDAAEEHQVLTGGGYDNTHIGQAREVSFDWLNREIKSIYNTPFSDIAMQCVNRLKAQYEAAGIKPGTLDLVDFSMVRDLSNTDGTIGIPILVHGRDIFTHDIANSIRDFYGVDMRSYVGKYVKLANYTGPVRVKDALNDLPFLMSSIGPDDMNMLVVQLSRTQRKGYKKLGEPKQGKFRTVKMPEVLQAICSGAIATAFKIEKEKGNVIPLLAGQLSFDAQIDDIYSEVKKMLGEGYTGFPLDESAYDASLIAGVMAAIILFVYQPLFKERYAPVFELVAYGFCNKLVITPILEEEDAWYASHNATPPETPKNSYFVRGYCLTYIQDKLISGDYLTQHLGSNYNYSIVQLATYVQLGYFNKIPLNVGKALGDDVLMYIPIDLIQRIGIDAVLKLIEQALSNFSIEANPSKQYVICYNETGEYLSVFLQRYYLASLNIKGIGSPARSWAGLPFSEYSPLESRPPQNMAMQDIGIISTANNGFNHPLIDGWIEFLFSKDPDLLHIFQVYGNAAYDAIIQAAGGMDTVKEAMSHLAYSPASGAASVVEGQPLPIIENMIKVANRMSRIGGSDLPSWLTKVQESVQVADEINETSETS